MNEIVKYSNKLHDVSFKSLTEVQQNVFFALLHRLRSTEGYILEISLNKLFELIDMPRNSDYANHVLNTLNRLQDFRFRFRVDDEENRKRKPEDRAIQQDIVFPSLKVNPTTKTLQAVVSKEFKDCYITSIEGGWTRYELAEFVGLSGKYTKAIYRYLKQFRSRGVWHVKFDTFKKLLGIPNSYAIRDINKQILGPAIEALTAERPILGKSHAIFQNLIVKKIKAGRKIDSIAFYFAPQSVKLETLQNQQQDQDRWHLSLIAHDIRVQRLKEKYNKELRQKQKEEREARRAAKQAKEQAKQAALLTQPVISQEPPALQLLPQNQIQTQEATQLDDCTERKAHRAELSKIVGNLTDKCRIKPEVLWDPDHYDTDFVRGLYIGRYVRLESKRGDGSLDTLKIIDVSFEMRHEKRAIVLHMLNPDDKFRSQMYLLSQDQLNKFLKKFGI